MHCFERYECGLRNNKNGKANSGKNRKQRANKWEGNR